MTFQSHFRAVTFTFVSALFGLAACSSDDPAFTHNEDPLRESTSGDPGPAESEWTAERPQAADSKAISADQIPNPESLFPQNPIGSGSRSTDGLGLPGASGSTAGKESTGASGGSAAGEETAPLAPALISEGEGIESTLASATGTTDHLKLTKSFSVQSAEKKSGTVVLSDGWVSQPLVLADVSEAVEQTHTQIERPVLTNSFVQGRGGVPSVEMFGQNAAAGVLDLLVVIDNSGSMSEEQVDLSTKLEPLLSSIQQSNWKLAVVTTDPDDGCMRELISKGDSDAAERFQTAIAEAGLSGSGNERGIFQAVNALSCASSPWLRQTSTVSVLVVSDEDNCSFNGSGCGDNAWNHPNYLLDHISGPLNRTIGQDARIYGLFKHPDDATCTTAYKNAVQYASAVAQSDGVWGSICANDYTQTLSQISADMASLLKNQFVLTKTPDPNTVMVTLIAGNGARTQVQAFSVAGNVITLVEAPPADAQIEVSYSTPSEPQLSSFTLSADPVAESVSITANGQPVDASHYTVTGKTLSFLEAHKPAPSASLQVSFKRNDPLVNTFSVDPAVQAETLSVKVNGTATTAFTLDSILNTVSLETPAPEGAVLSIGYQKSLAPQLSYPIMNSEAPITEVRAQFADEEAVPLSLTGNTITLTNAAQHMRGKTLWVQHRVADAVVSTHELPEVPLANTLVASSSQPGCRVGQEVVLDGQKIHINCRFEGPLTVSYAYSAGSTPKREFVIFESEEQMNNLGQNLSIKVSLDDRVVSPESYQWVGGTLHLAGNLDLSSAAVLKVTASATAQ